MRRVSHAVLVVVFLAVAPAVARAATSDVCPSGCTFTTISGAIAFASPGDTVRVHAGTYNESLSIPSAISVVGAGSTMTTVQNFAAVGSLVTLSGDGASLTGMTLSPPADVRALHVTASANVSDVALNGLSGTAVDGLAVLADGALASVSITDSTFVSPTNSSAAPIVHVTNTASLSLVRVTISNALAPGAEVLLGDGSSTLTLDTLTLTCDVGTRGMRVVSNAGLTMTNGSVSSCDGTGGAGSAGALFYSPAAGGSPAFSIDGTTFSSNVAHTGGAIYYYGRAGAVGTIANATFTNNGATTFVPAGGAIYAGQGTLTVRDSTFTGNSTSGVGEAIAIAGSTTVNVVRSRLCGQLNMSAGTGGVIRIDGGTLNVSNTLFGGNQGDAIEGQTGVTAINVDHSAMLGNQGAIFRRTTLSLTNSVVAYDTPYGAIGGLVSGGTTTIENNLFYMNSPEASGLSATNLIGVDPRYFAYDSTMPCASDLRVRVGSPLIDAGRGPADSDGSTADIGLHGGAGAAPSWWADADGDGSPYVYDCAPTNAAVYPGHAELCNGIDDDCDLVVDDGLGLGTSCTSGLGPCARGGTVVCSGTSAVCSATAGTPGTELCGTGIDEDCNGLVDDGFAGLGAACSAGVGACARSGTNVCSTDRLSVTCDAAPGAPTTELCGTGIDEDCNGMVDEGFPGVGASCSVGLGDCARSGANACSADGLSVACGATPGTPGVEVCGGGDEDCDGLVDEGGADCSASPAGASCIGSGSPGAHCGCTTDADCAGVACDPTTSTCMGTPDAGVDAGIDAGVDAGMDAGIDAAVDATVPLDAGTDASPTDAGERDAGDASRPDAAPTDAASSADAGPMVSRGGCCGVAGAGGSGSGALVVTVGLGLAALRRRRPRRPGAVAD